MNWDLLIQHLQLAILLGALSSGVVETLKNWFFADLKGRKLTILTVALTAVISGVIGYVYSEAAGADLAAAVIWGMVGAQAIYATVQELQGKIGGTEDEQEQ